MGDGEQLLCAFRLPTAGIWLIGQQRCQTAAAGVPYDRINNNVSICVSYITSIRFDGTKRKIKIVRINFGCISLINLLKYNGMVVFDVCFAP